MDEPVIEAGLENMDELVIEASLENMDKVQDFVSGRLKGCSLKLKNQIGIVVDEIFSNISRYAYNPVAGYAVVRIAIENDIMIEFEDSGASYDPLSIDDPDISLSADEREIGGLGIFMVKNIMDSVEYRREGNKNVLTIKKNLK